MPASRPFTVETGAVDRAITQLQARFGDRLSRR